MKVFSDYVIIIINLGLIEIFFVKLRIFIYFLKLCLGSC